VGSRDFITVNLPLFKEAGAELPTEAKGLDLKKMGLDPSQLILPADGAKLGRAYRVMLQRLLDAVPNITLERSALGGFSNGAHATAALLGCGDDFILAHFRAYVLAEGGMSLGLDTKVLEEPALKDSRILMLTGEAQADPKMQLARQLFAEPLLEALGRECAARRIDFRRVVMKGYGHQFPREYFPLVDCWLRGKDLPEVAPKPSPAK
jgi:hypothetical protein